MSRSRNGRYYDDSDDMVERIRRAREAFNKKANAFQGPDWPHYDKRVIVGMKKKEDVLATQAQADSAVAPSGTETMCRKMPRRQPPIKHPHGGPLTDKRRRHPQPLTQTISRPRATTTPTT